MTGLPAASYADAHYRDPLVSISLAMARRSILEAEIFAQAAIAEKAVADVLKAVMGGERDYERMDDMATELARAALRLRKRSRELARRKPERRPRPPLVCPQCDYTIVEGSRPSAVGSRQESSEAADVEPGTLNVELPVEESGCRGTLLRARAPRFGPESTQQRAPTSRKTQTAEDIKKKVAISRDGRGRPRPYAPESDVGVGATHASPERGPACEQEKVPPSPGHSSSCGRGMPRPYASESDTETVDRGLRSLPRKERRRLAAIERKRQKKMARAKRREQRELVEAMPGGT